jgi:8-amino-7-oxononanoate synthase
MIDTDYYKSELEQLKQSSAYRELIYKKSGYIDMSGNDYLGIAANPGLYNDFCNNFLSDQEYKMGACSSRLLSGNHMAAEKLEQWFEQWYGRPSLLFNSGYHANTGMLPALTSANHLIVADKMVHASMIDGIRLSKAKFERFKHNDINHLIRILEKNRLYSGKIVIAVESVYSMDGDVAPLEELVDIKNRYNAMLIVDEAHGFGVFGDTGKGLCEQLGVTDQVDIIVGTLGKAASSVGAFAVCSELIKNYLINKMRSLIFSTALPPINNMWSLYTTKLITDMHQERKQLKCVSDMLRKEITEAGFSSRGASQIVPLIAGSNEKALELYNMFDNDSIDARPVRYPTVPKGSERIRFSLSAAHTAEDINAIKKVLKRIKH